MHFILTLSINCLDIKRLRVRLVCDFFLYYDGTDAEIIVLHGALMRFLKRPRYGNVRNAR